jgi:hypothetical protein
MKKSVCFAYFGDGKFIGWYADTTGSVSQNAPKIYGYSPSQVEIIATNFRSKMKKLNVKSNLGSIVSGLEILDRSLDYDSKILSQYQTVELRVVECSVYDGPNPNFDEVRHKNWSAYDRTPFYEPGNLNWIYADYKKVNEWAMNVPTEFLEVITAE